MNSQWSRIFALNSECAKVNMKYKKANFDFSSIFFWNFVTRNSNEIISSTHKSWVYKWFKCLRNTWIIWACLLMTCCLFCHYWADWFGSCCATENIRSTDKNWLLSKQSNCVNVYQPGQIDWLKHLTFRTFIAVITSYDWHASDTVLWSVTIKSFEKLSSRGWKCHFNWRVYIVEHQRTEVITFELLAFERALPLQ